MIEMRKHIHKSLSTRLCIDILLVVVLVFSLSLGFLYWQSRYIIREEAIDEASHVLDNTALRVKGYMVEVETATRNILWLVNLHTFDQDSLLKYTHRIVANHPNTNGCFSRLNTKVTMPATMSISAKSCIRVGSSAIISTIEQHWSSCCVCRISGRRSE